MRPLGRNGPVVNEVGFGLMGISAHYGAAMKDEDGFKLLDRAIEIGCTFWDTSDMYGDNEAFVGRYFASRPPETRAKVFLATKFGIANDAEGNWIARNDEEYILQQSAASLKALNVSYIDLYYIHRIDFKTPIEKTMRILKTHLVDKGLVKYLGLSEATSETIRRAHKIYPVSAVQMEYSAFSLEFEDEGLALGKTCAELGIAIVAYSPLGRGILGGKLKSYDDLDEDDFRRTDPRFSPENFHNNLDIVRKLEQFGQKHSATSGQVGLAWLLAQGAFVIPGTTKIANLEDNVAAGQLKLEPSELEELNEVIHKADIKGDRYSGTMKNLSLIDTPPE